MGSRGTCTLYIHSVKMVNFKSIGEKDNDIIIEPRVTAIIGKNESGKSNVMEGLSYISFTGNMNTAFNADNINRNNGTNATIEYTIILKPNPQERDSLNITDDTKIIISKEKYLVTGGILEYYNTNIRGYTNELVDILGKNPFELSGQDYQNYQNHIAALRQEKSLNIKPINIALDFLETRIERLKIGEKGEIANVFSSVRQKWDSVLSMLPNIFYRNTDKILKTRYMLDEVQKELQSPASYPNSLLSDFVKLIGISNDDFITAVQAGTSGQKITIRDKINRKVESIINAEFKTFYVTETVSLNVAIDSNTISFSVRSSEGETLLLSERSNGLKWYLNTFIDAKAHGISQSNVVYLFDEPGISLHVNAQKELLNLFEDLANKGNQVVYTTHSPYMLNLRDDGIHRIRALEKDSQGYTHIYKTAYDARLSPQNQQDTIAPIVNAIGMSLYDNVGPAKDKLNIVTEGVSDYIYLHTMRKILEIDMSKINIIPAVGATNCLNICNILHGWKCPFVALFDYDKEGVECGGEKMRKSLLYEMGRQYIYLIDINQESIDLKEYNQSPYMIEDLVGRDILDDFIKQKGLLESAVTIDKTLLAKLFCNALEDGSYCIDSECKSRFENLFDRISGIYKMYHL